LNEIIILEKDIENKMEITKNELKEIITIFQQKTILLETLSDKNETLKNLQIQIKNSNNHYQIVEILERSIQENNSKFQSIESWIDKLKNKFKETDLLQNKEKKDVMPNNEKFKEEKFISPQLFSELIEFSKENELTLLDPFVVPNFIPQPFESFLETQEDKIEEQFEIKMPFQMKLSNIEII
jgi:hypothetical protein